MEAVTVDTEIVMEVVMEAMEAACMVVVVMEVACMEDTVVWVECMEGKEDLEWVWEMILINKVSCRIV